MAVVYSKHAKEMLKLRRIKQSLVNHCVCNPDYILPGQENRKIYLKDCGINFLKVVILKETGDTVIITAHWLAKKRLKK